MKIGWLADNPPYKGGAELCAAELLANAPSYVEIVPMAANAVHNNVDAFVIHNCTEYGSFIIPILETKPVIKYVHDVWPHGDPILKKWLGMKSALMVLSSPLHRQSLNMDISCPTAYVPNAINLNRYYQADANGTHVLDTCWVGRFHPDKGLENAAAWAKRNNRVIDWYGNGMPLPEHFGGNYCGKLMPEQVADTMAKYRTFVFLPDEVEPFSRVVVEAWAAGCEVVTNGNVGAVWWIETRPNDLARGAEMFWACVRDSVAVGV